MPVALDSFCRPPTRRFFDLPTRKDVESGGELWHPDGAILVSYPPDGFPLRIEGKSAILEGFMSLLGTSSPSRRADHRPVPGR
jgi:hypothetical protein